MKTLIIDDLEKESINVLADIIYHLLCKPKGKKYILECLAGIHLAQIRIMEAIQQYGTHSDETMAKLLADVKYTAAEDLKKSHEEIEALKTVFEKKLAELNIDSSKLGLDKEPNDNGGVLN